LGGGLAEEKAAKMGDLMVVCSVVCLAVTRVAMKALMTVVQWVVWMDCLMVVSKDVTKVVLMVVKLGLHLVEWMELCWACG